MEVVRFVRMRLLFGLKLMRIVKLVGEASAPVLLFSAVGIWFPLLTTVPCK